MSFTLDYLVLTKKNPTQPTFFCVTAHKSICWRLVRGQNKCCPKTLPNASILLQSVSLSAMHRPGGQLMFGVLLGQYMSLFLYQSFFPFFFFPPKNVNNEITKKVGNHLSMFGTLPSKDCELYNEGS